MTRMMIRRPGHRFNRRNLAGGSPGPFDPASIANLELYLRADVGVTGDPASAWADQSGNGNDFAQGSSTRQPAQVTWGSGTKALRFKTGGAFEKGMQNSSLSLSGGDYSIYAVGQFDLTNVNCILFDSQGTGSARLWVHNGYDASGEKIGWYDGTYRHAGAATGTGNLVASWTLPGGGTGRAYENTTELGNAAVASGRGFGGTVALGSSWLTYTNTIEADIAAFLLYSDAHDVATQATIANGLAGLFPL